MYGEEERRYTGFLWGNLADLGVDGKIILK
jgi:hypothetical protein